MAIAIAGYVTCNVIAIPLAIASYIKLQVFSKFIAAALNLLVALEPSGLIDRFD